MGATFNPHFKFYAQVIYTVIRSSLRINILKAPASINLDQQKKTIHLLVFMSKFYLKYKFCNKVNHPVFFKGLYIYYATVLWIPDTYTIKYLMFSAHFKIKLSKIERMELELFKF